MIRRILADIIPGQSRMAVLEDGKLVEYYMERPGSERPAGNIYKGKVVNVLPGMDAAFVDIGLEKNAFLYVGDVALNRDDFEFKSQRKSDMPDIRDVVKQDQELLVQVVKDPLGGKGARITTHVTLPGHMLVLMPTMDYVGVSRRIEDETERERLKALVEEVRPKGMGVIVRTVAEGCNGEEFTREIKELVALWEEIDHTVKRKNTPSLIHRDSDLLMRAVRDLCSQDTKEFIINNKEEFERVKALAKRLAPLWKGEIIYNDTDIFQEYQMESKVDRTLARRVWLKNGAYLVLDHTEALTVIDVNSGKFVGTSHLQDTIVKVNKEAAAEIARQVRLRDIGGIIIIDFIDMQDEGSQQEVVDALKKALKRDRTRTNVVGMTGLGLVEMTRKKIRQRVATLIHKTCPYCNGSGRVYSEETVALKVVEEYIKQQRENGDVDYVLKVHSDVADYIESEGLLPKNVNIYRSRSAHIEYFRLTLE